MPDETTLLDRSGFLAQHDTNVEMRVQTRTVGSRSASLAKAVAIVTKGRVAPDVEDQVNTVTSAPPRTKHRTTISRSRRRQAEEHHRTKGGTLSETERDLGSWRPRRDAPAARSAAMSPPP